MAQKTVQTLGALRKIFKQAKRVQRGISQAKRRPDPAFPEDPEVIRDKGVWNELSLGRAIKNVSTETLIGALRNAGKIEDVQIQTTEIPIDKAILVTGLLVGLEVALLEAINNIESVEIIIDNLILIPDLLLEDIKNLDFEFELTQTAVDEVFTLDLVLDKLLDSMEKIGQQGLKAVKEIDALTAIVDLDDFSLEGEELKTFVKEEVKQQLTFIEDTLEED